MTPRKYSLIGTFIAINSFWISSALAQGTLVEEVSNATQAFSDVTQAEAGGWLSAGSCVSGPDQGAMGIHYINQDLVEDAALDPLRPEALIYEAAEGGLQFVGVEFIAIAEAWHAANGPNPPVLLGQLFHFNGSPNRFGLPDFYSLHVWVGKENPNGEFTNWNPAISCVNYAGEPATPPTPQTP